MGREVRTFDGGGYQVWETTSDGSPISPVFRDREACIRWLTQPKGAPGLGIGGRRLRLTREAAERFVEDGYAPSMFYSPRTGIRAGVEGFE